MDVVTLASVPAILALVNLAKGMGLAGKFSALVALGLGIVFGSADYYFTVLAAEQTQAGFYAAAVAGAVLGLSASGLYDVAGKFGQVEVVEIADEEVEVVDDDVNEEVFDEPIEGEEVEPTDAV